MLNKSIDANLNARIIVLMLVVALACWGIYAIYTTPVEAIQTSRTIT